MTGAETFRIALARCSVARAGRKILVRNEPGSLVIWSEDEEFLLALAQSPSGALREQVRRIQRAARRQRWLATGALAVAALAGAYVASVPALRWAVQGGVPAIAGWIGDASLERLALPSGQAPTVERELGVIADRLRPDTAPSIRPFRLLLADYGPVHSFSLPPRTVVVTSGLVCDADRPDVVMAAVARELAHLESRDVSQRVAEAVDQDTALALVRGDVSKLRGRMLDFADPRRSPGFTPEQDAAAQVRARAMLAQAGVTPGEGQAPTALPSSSGPPAAPAAPPAAGDEARAVNAIPGAVDWARVRAEACELIGH